MRVQTAFKRMLRLPGASVVEVSFGAEGVIVTVRLRRRRRVCSRCGQTGSHLQIHDRRTKRWRHLDLGSTRCVIECELRRLRCPDCGVHLEAVPWARPGASHTRDFEDVVAWLAQQMAKTPIAGLLRIAWDTVGQIVERVVAEQLDEERLQGLLAIGVDEISYRRHHRYLTSVVDHRSGAIVWCAPGRNSETLKGFFDVLGERKRSIRAVSIDMSGGYEKAISNRRSHGPRSPSIPSTSYASPSARWTRSVATSGTRTSAPTRRKGKWIKGTRWPLLKAPEKQNTEQLALLAEVQQANRSLYRAFLLKEELRLLYQLAASVARPRAPRRLAGVGVEIEARAVREARAHDPPATATASSLRSASG